MHATFHDDERALFTRLRTYGDPADREAAVRRYLPLARRLANRYRDSGEPIEDLEQVAAIGLLHAIDRFDPERGTAFTTFAVPTILGEVRRHFRDRTWALRVPRVLQELTMRIEQARDAMTGVLGREPTLAELAQRLDVGEELLLQALELSFARFAYSLDEARGDGDGSEPGVRGLIDDGYGRVEDRVTLAELLATLTPRDAEIVFLRFHGDLTQDAIARRVGLSQMHVSRVLRRSLVRLGLGARR